MIDSDPQLLKDLAGFVERKRPSGAERFKAEITIKVLVDANIDKKDCKLTVHECLFNVIELGCSGKFT